MATATVAPHSTRSTRTRDSVARRLIPMLTDEPQAAATLAERGDILSSRGKPETRLVLDALRVAFSWREARRIPNTAGSPQGGWVRWDSPLKVKRPAIDVAWPFKRLEWVDVWMIGVDRRFQRPLTALVERIEADFNFEMFAALILSDRGREHEAEFGWRYSAIDGQTRWVAAANIGVPEVPSIVYQGLTFREESGLFWRLQKHRTNVTSAVQFNARLVEGDEEAIAVASLAQGCGYGIGTQTGEIRSAVALERCFKRDAVELERALAAFHEGWDGTVPESRHIKGLHYLLRYYPVEKDGEYWDIDDEQLVRRLKANGPADIDKKLLSVRELHTGSADKLMALAFQAAYRGRR